MNQSQHLHFSELKNSVFEVSKYPSFLFFLDYLHALFDKLNQPTNSVCFLERTQLYGSSLFTGLFDSATAVSIDISPSTAKSRGSYNSHLIDTPNFLPKQSDHFLSQDVDSIGTDIYDYIIVPNLVHHFKNQEKLYSIVFKALKPCGTVIIYEPTIREFHQIPNDYLRFTPYGLTEYLKCAGFTNISFEEEGNAYSALRYILQIMSIGRELNSPFLSQINLIANQIKALEMLNQKDIIKPHSSFPTSFIINANKP